jgi:hypothetical protein
VPSAPGSGAANEADEKSASGVSGAPIGVLDRAAAAAAHACALARSDGCAAGAAGATGCAGIAGAFLRALPAPAEFEALEERARRPPEEEGGCSSGISENGYVSDAKNDREESQTHPPRLLLHMSRKI